jgi:FkbM family methyltransferase
MRYYIDLGTYEGELMEKVMSKFPPFDFYIGFEPYPKLYEKAIKRFSKDDRVIINNLAVAVKDGEEKLYIDYFNKKKQELCPTLFKNKKNVDKNKFIYVNTINFSKYVIDNFKKSDYILLKIDIEGEEYNLLEYMMTTGSIEYINKIYCEWHYRKFKKCKNRWMKNKERKKHNNFIDRLNKYKFNLTGENYKDELSFLIDDMRTDK